MPPASFSSLDLSKTPTPLPPAPRTIRLRAGQGCGLWPVRLFILPHTIAGVGALLFLLFLILFALFGTNLPGNVTSAKTYTSKGKQHYTLYYTYTVNNTTYHDHQSVNAAGYARFHSDKVELPAGASAVTVRHFAIGPVHYSDLPDYESPWSLIGFLFLWCLFWNSVMCLVLYQVWYVPYRNRSIVKHGEPISAIISSKRSATGKTTSYYVTYIFEDPATGKTITSETQVPRSAWQSAIEGMDITVLYNPSNPRRNYPYEVGDYEIA